MRYLFTTILTIGFYITPFAQIDFKSPPWEIGCDSLTTQTGMNICSYEKFHIADSILNSYYIKLLTSVDSLITRELKEYKQIPSIDQKNYIKQLRGQKKSILNSREYFKLFLDSTTDIIDYQYTGGSMRSQAVNNYALDLTVNQIKVLIKLIDEITHFSIA